MTQWHEHKRELWKDLVFYGAIIVLSVSWDVLMRLNSVINGDVPAHPLKFGMWQIVIAGVAVWRFYEKWDDWRHTPDD